MRTNPIIKLNNKLRRSRIPHEFVNMSWGEFDNVHESYKLDYPAQDGHMIRVLWDDECPTNLLIVLKGAEKQYATWKYAFQIIRQQYNEDIQKK